MQWTPDLADTWAQAYGLAAKVMVAATDEREDIAPTHWEAGSHCPMGGLEEVTHGDQRQLTEHAGGDGASYCDARSGGDNWSSVLSFLIINCLTLLEVYWLPVCRRLVLPRYRAAPLLLSLHHIFKELKSQARTTVLIEVSVSVSVRWNTFTKLHVADWAQAIVGVREAGLGRRRVLPHETLLRGRTDHG
jgi:hypothetical protein